jgi:hypothetical protein
MRQFTTSWLATPLFGLVVGLGTPAYAAQLFGVTGDGAPVNPESLFSVSIVDASTALIQPLGNGNDGESIAFNPTDGLMYHWSGLFNDATQIMETINLNDQTVTDIPTDFSFYDPAEVFGSTFDPSAGNFLFTDINANLGSVTPRGEFSVIGPLPAFDIRGLGFNGGLLFAGGRFSDTLHEINPSTGAGLSSIPVTLPGFTVQGINALTTDPDTGILYAILKTSGATTGRRLATIDPDTGVAADIGLLPNGFANIEFGPAERRAHFLCYKARSAKGESKFERLDVDLDDQFGATTKTVKKPMFLCTPVATDGEPVIDPAGHLVCYEVKGQKGQDKFKKRDVLVFNQFEDAEEGRILTIKKPEILCVPSTKKDLGAL